MYKDFENSAQPAESSYSGTPATVDLTGRTIAGAPKYTFNVGADYRIPVSLWALGQKQFHTSVNWAFTSSYNADPLLSDYAVIPSNSLWDWSIGLSTLDNKFEVNLIVNNLFDNDTPLGYGGTTAAWNSYTAAKERWAGVEFSGRF